MICGCPRTIHIRQVAHCIVQP